MHMDRRATEGASDMPITDHAEKVERSPLVVGCSRETVCGSERLEVCMEYTIEGLDVQIVHSPRSVNASGCPPISQIWK